LTRDRTTPVRYDFLFGRSRSWSNLDMAISECCANRWHATLSASLFLGWSALLSTAVGLVFTCCCTKRTLPPWYYSARFSAWARAHRAIALFAVSTSVRLKEQTVSESDPLILQLNVIGSGWVELTSNYVGSQFDVTSLERRM